ncbi:hypothetical protein PsorP6_006784 [Peronosclerospora sorghi]|uniref:Uncharacterized protein n=1 Tax=Peronosclerospora sorghi TaxID=230839 RepID=A0ACC0W2A4_9STRA|nr:hypothetical protein PsorP6_006784 [Peronosclerospora sorghi]
MQTESWLKEELVSALGFTDVTEIVTYITTTFHSKQEVESYLIELLGIPATRAELISLRLFSAERLRGPQGPLTIVEERGHEGLVPRPKERHKFSRKDKKNVAVTLPNNTLIINCLRCGKIEYNGGRCCEFCGTELRYEVDEVMADRSARGQDETRVERSLVPDVHEYRRDDEENRT